jgi:hypothetical protein
MVRQNTTMLIDRRRGAAPDAFVSVRLTHKYADAIDGVDLAHMSIGDVVRLPVREAALLMAEGWAVECGGGTNADRDQSSTVRDEDAEHRPHGHAPASTNAPFEWGHVGPPQRSVQQPSEPTKE